MVSTSAPKRASAPIVSTYVLPRRVYVHRSSLARLSFGLKVVAPAPAAVEPAAFVVAPEVVTPALWMFSGSTRSSSCWLRMSKTFSASPRAISSLSASLKVSPNDKGPATYPSNCFMGRSLFRACTSMAGASPLAMAGASPLDKVRRIGGAAGTGGGTGEGDMAGGMGEGGTGEGGMGEGGTEGPTAAPSGPTPSPRGRRAASISIPSELLL